MKRLGVVGVACAALLIVGYKVKSAPRDNASGPAPTRTAIQPSVALFADPAEADSECGCGEVIRAVRAAAKRGVTVREIPPDSDVTLAKQYKVTIIPTVLMLNVRGAEVERFEGESEKVIASLRSRLDTLSGKK